MNARVAALVSAAAFVCALAPCVADAPGAVYGRSLADLEAEAFADARSLKDAKRVLRAALDACLDGRALKSREVMLAMRRRVQ